MDEKDTRWIKRWMNKIPDCHITDLSMQVEIHANKFHGEITFIKYPLKS